ncbi:hypothetical protein E2C01_083567 [Portunus trituberculatus]|uniref:Uncharacterized protein n=1 Tax=Portunus trituberculatus TaxID=210409 RepID=A0A5B7IST6_PORTR|nr:hypothetical protein [Portunus trituberculatus]
MTLRALVAVAVVGMAGADRDSNEMQGLDVTRSTGWDGIRTSHSNTPGITHLYLTWQDYRT